MAPRLRTKTGCLTCLERRKKCDETKPTCRTCARLHKSCVWRGSTDGTSQSNQHEPINRPGPLQCEPNTTSKGGSHSRRPIALAAPPSPLSFSPPRVITGHSGFRSLDDQSMFAYFVKVFGPMMCDGRSHPFYRDNSYLVAIALHVPWVMDSILAVAAYHHASMRDESSVAALRYYGRALKGLQERVADRTLLQDPVLGAIIFIGVFEQRLHSEQGPSSTHFNTCLTLLRALAPSLKGYHSKSRQAFLRQQSDMTIYQIATRAILQQQVQQPADVPALEDLYVYINDIMPGDDALPSSSFLGPVPELFMLVYRVSLLARMHSRDVSEMIQARGYLQRVKEIKTLSDLASSLHFAREDLALPFLAGDCTPRLYILALEIMIARIIQPGLSNSHPDIQSRVSEAQRLLCKRSFVYALVAASPTDMSYHLAEPLCWPVMVIGVAAVRQEERETFRRVLDDLYKVSCNGFVRRISTILHRAWGEKEENTTQVSTPTTMTASKVSLPNSYFSALGINPSVVS